MMNSTTNWHSAKVCKVLCGWKKGDTYDLSPKIWKMAKMSTPISIPSLITKVIIVLIITKQHIFN